MRTRLALAAFPVGLAALVALAGSREWEQRQQRHRQPRTSARTGEEWRRSHDARTRARAHPHGQQRNTVYVVRQGLRGGCPTATALRQRVAAGDSEREAHGGQRGSWAPSWGRPSAATESSKPRSHTAGARCAPTRRTEPGRRHGNGVEQIGGLWYAVGSRTARRDPRPGSSSNGTSSTAARPRAAPRAADTVTDADDARLRLSPLLAHGGSAVQGPGRGAIAARGDRL